MSLYRVIVACVVVLFALPAIAQDKKDTPFNWTGFYIGANAGVNFLSSSTYSQCVTPSGAFNGTGCTQPEYASSSAAAGFAGGVQGGYNYQWNWIVMGAELDASVLTASALTSYGNAGGSIGNANQPNTITAKTEVPWMSTLRAKLGAADGPLMFYGTGGLALASVHFEIQQRFAAVYYPYTQDAVMLGFAAGGGFEYAVADHLTVRAEAIYYDLGFMQGNTFSNPQVTNFRGGGTTYTTGVITRVGASYKF